MKEKAAEYRLALIEAAVELDDEAMGAYLDGKEPDEETLRGLIRKAVIGAVFFPVFCGSAFKNKGCAAFARRQSSTSCLRLSIAARSPASTSDG